MFVYSLKATSIKFIAVIVVSVMALIALLVLVPEYEEVSASIGDGKINYDHIKDDTDRIAFAKQFGWEITPTPTETEAVTVPAEFDTVYESYNAIQQAQGLNLERYRGKTVMRYTYAVTNYPNYDGPVYFNLLMYKNKVIGGDICSAALDGFVHGFEK